MPRKGNVVLYRFPVIVYTSGTAQKTKCLQRSLRRNGIKGATVRLSPTNTMVVHVRNAGARRLRDWSVRVARAEKACKF